MAIRVVVIEDHPLMLKAVTDLLADQPDIRVVGSANHGKELPRLLHENMPDVVILDLGMSGGQFEPISAVRELRRDYPQLKIIILTGYDDDVYIHELFDAGAQGYVLKSDNLSLTLASGIRQVHAGDRFLSDEVINKLLDKRQAKEMELTDQEIAIIRLAAKGLSNARIGEILNLSDKRIRNMFTDIYEKLNAKELEGVNLRVMAINIARKKGLLPEE